MDILIKGLDMPKYGDIFHLAIDSDGNVIKTEGIGFRKYEAIPIPKHGRLCDFDEAYTDIDYILCKNCEKSCSVCDVPWIKKVISQAPTVLEATK